MRTRVRYDQEPTSIRSTFTSIRGLQEEYRCLSLMVSLPTRHNIHSTHISQDYRPYYIPSRSTGFIVPTHNVTPPSQHSNTRPVCSLSQYIVDIGSSRRHKTLPKSTNRVGFLHLKSYGSSMYSVLVLNMHYQHGAVAVTVTVLTAKPHNRATKHNVCRTWNSFTNSTGQIDDRGMPRHRFHCTFIMLVC